MRPFSPLKHRLPHLRSVSMISGTAPLNTAFTPCTKFEAFGDDDDSGIDWKVRSVLGAMILAAKLVSPPTIAMPLGNAVTVAPKDKDTTEEHQFTFHPKHSRIARVDRKFTDIATFVFGGRKGLEHLPDDRDSDNWTSEAGILKRASEYGKRIDLIGDHIPDMVVYHSDPPLVPQSRSAHFSVSRSKEPGFASRSSGGSHRSISWK
ncbi:hypothetical protein BJ322DRAFT_1109105 [Thelephora terrestris]|uniref:Uncharacterized protein n=1 Tax=Thelephora terrestris TaxID=56493 RepID=A0A9P6L6E7_9AGAM|nr:hypothetical protein BJ322DRAFT_1109105 [Thelephora terrestris]